MARPTVTEYLADGTRRMHLRDGALQPNESVNLFQDIYEPMVAISDAPLPNRMNGGDTHNESTNPGALGERALSRLQLTDPVDSAAADSDVAARIAERRRNTMEFTFARFRMLAEQPERLRDTNIEELAISAMWAAANDPQASPRARTRAARNMRAYTHILQNLRGVGSAVVSLTNFDEFANRNRDADDAAPLPDDEPTHGDREATEELVAATAEHSEFVLDVAMKLSDDTEALKASYLAVLKNKMERLEQRVEDGFINEAIYKRKADRLMRKYNQALVAFGMESEEEEEEEEEEEQRMRAPLTLAEREQFRTVMEQEEQEMEAEEEEEVEVD